MNVEPNRLFIAENPELRLYFAVFALHGIQYETYIAFRCFGIEKISHYSM